MGLSMWQVQHLMEGDKVRVCFGRDGSHYLECFATFLKYDSQRAQLYAQVRITQIVSKCGEWEYSAGDDVWCGRGHLSLIVGEEYYRNRFLYDPYPKDNSSTSALDEDENPEKEGAAVGQVAKWKGDINV